MAQGGARRSGSGRRSEFMRISEAVKAEKDKETTYSIDKGDVRISTNGGPVSTVPGWKFGQHADLLLERMKEQSKKSKIEIPELEGFLNEIEVTTLKSASKNKADISVVALNAIDEECLMRFSVKSELGGKPTLLNASNATRMEFAVIGVPEDRIEEINAIDGGSKIKRRVQAVYELGGRLEPVGAASPAFRYNLGLTDSRFGELISAMMLCHYLNGNSSRKIPGDEKPYLIKNLVEQVKRERPVPGMDPGTYEYHVKLFLSHVALGMRPDERWDGTEETDGGFIEVEEDGTIRAIPLQNRDELKTFLYDGTRLDTPAGGRTGNGEITFGDGGPTMSLTLQIRFARGTGGGESLRKKLPTRNDTRGRTFIRPEEDACSWTRRSKRLR